MSTRKGRLILYAALALLGVFLARWLLVQRRERPAADVPQELTRDQLYERAKELDIEGRSKMNKEQLARAIRRATDQL
jgi:hypothetical protein